MLYLFEVFFIVGWLVVGFGYGGFGILGLLAFGRRIVLVVLVVCFAWVG